MGNETPAVLERRRLARDEALVERSFWRKLRRTLGRIPFAEEILAAYFCATDRATPLYVKAILMGAIAYFVVPTDMIPDFIASLGFTDDAAVLTAAMAAVREHIRPRHRERARAALEGETRGADAPAPDPST